MIETDGESLTQDFWGAYVAFWKDQRTGQIGVLRDPCGALPAYFIEHNGATLYFAHAEDISGLPDLRFNIDWTYLRAFVAFNYFVTPHTGLAEIQELLPGQRHLRTPDRARRTDFAWNGALIAARPRRLDFVHATTEMRQTAEACFSAWGRLHRHIIVSLSGGLDSSILVNLLRRSTNTQITALHYLGVDYERFEADLARKAAAHAGIELVEVEQNPASEPIERILTTPRMARPKIQMLALQIDDISLNLAAQRNADCFMIGQGGDNIFLQRGGAGHTLSDYLRLEGLGSDFTGVAYAAATLRQTPMSSILSEALAAALSRRWDPYAFLDQADWRLHRPFTADAFASIPDAYKIHPWLKQAERLPRGKAEHLLAIIALNNYYLDHLRGLTHDVIYPFVSQPIVELALQTPTYLLAQGGVDRALERAAFSDLLPPAIARRTGKGGADTYLLQVMQRHLSFYRELILDGELIDQGWLDRDRVEAMLRPDHIVRGQGAMFAYLLVAAEAWLQAWRSRAHASVANALPAA